jgi:hypothetical protein
MAPDIWHHVVATYDSASLRLYVDGKLHGPQAMAGLTQIDFSTVRFGLAAGSASNPLTGTIDEVFLGSGVMSQTIVNDRWCPPP